VKEKCESSIAKRESFNPAEGGTSFNPAEGGTSFNPAEGGTTRNSLPLLLKFRFVFRNLQFELSYFLHFISQYAFRDSQYLFLFAKS